MDTTKCNEFVVLSKTRNFLEASEQLNISQSSLSKHMQSLEKELGVTLLELFAFLGENLLYRANQIPERNRLKFLQLLNLPLQPATPARARLYDSGR